MVTDWRVQLLDDGGNLVAAATPLPVNVVAGGITITAGMADDDPFTQGTTAFAPVGGEYTTTPAAVTDGSAAACQITQNRALHVNLRDSAGAAMLPATAAVADAAATPTTTKVATTPLVYNGATWDMLRGANAANNAAGTGVPAAGLMAWDNTNNKWFRAQYDPNGSGVFTSADLFGGGNTAFDDTGTFAYKAQNRRAAAPSPLPVVGAYWTGAAWHRTRTPATFKVMAAVSVATEATVWTPAAGKKFRLMALDISGSVAGAYVFKDNTAGTTIYECYLAANTPRYIPLGNGILSGVADRVLTCTGPAAATITGTVHGTEE